MKTYWIHRTEDGVFELRQWRFRERFLQWSENHIHDVCGIALTREQMHLILLTLNGDTDVDWVFHDDPRSDDFVLTKRSSGSCWLHKTYPIWIVEYHEFASMKQPRHWQVYIGKGDLSNRKPWIDDNVKLNRATHGYKDPIDAIKAAYAYADYFERNPK